MVQNVNNKSASDRVILELWGIDKKWVFHNGSWVDMATLPENQVKEESTEEDTEVATKKPWWKFWSSNR